MTGHPYDTPATAQERQTVYARIQTQCCLPEGEGGCWLWRGNGAGDSTRRPRISFRGEGQALRRVVYFLRHGALPPLGECATGCGEPDCVSPHCIQAAPRRAILRRAAEAGRCSTPWANLSRKMAAQARTVHNAAAVELARTLPCSAAEAARITGMSKAHVVNIRAGRARTLIEPAAPIDAAQAVERERTQRLDRVRAARATAGVWGGLLTL